MTDRQQGENVEFRHVGSFAQHGHDGMGWLGGVDIYVKAEDYDTHVNYSADAFAIYAENARLRAALVEARTMVADWAGYASDYFKEKWDLEGDLRSLDEVIAAPVELPHSGSTVEP